MPGGNLPQTWGAKRCSLCTINYPNLLRFSECPVCGEKTTYFANIRVDEDWLENAASRAKQWDGEIPDAPPSS